MKSKQMDTVEIGGKQVPRNKVCYKMKDTDHEVNGQKKHFKVASDRAYLQDETSGTLIRLGDRKLGKKAKKAAKRAKIAERNLSK